MVDRATSRCRLLFLAVTLTLIPGTAIADSGVPLVISEIMSHPADGLDSEEATWFEVHNPSDVGAPLSGLLIEDHALGSYLVYRPGEIPPGGFVIFGATKVPQLNGGVPVDVAYDDEITMEALGGSLSLWRDGDLLDAVTYGGPLWPATPPGVSATLEPTAATPELNDDPARWCLSMPLDLDGEPGPATTTNPGAWGGACDSDGDGLSEDQGDCDDGDPDVLPGVGEKCNGFDDNCDDVIDGEDELPDGPTCSPYGVCGEITADCTGASGWVCPYPETWEDEETLCDGLDNDCDGDTDEGLRNNCGDCGPPLEDDCDGLDNDCDGDTDEDAPPPSPEELCAPKPRGVCVGMQVVCAGEEGWVCLLPDAFEAEEVLCDGLDNDCDGDTDEGYGVGDACLSGQGACEEAGVLVCAPNRLGVSCIAEGGREIGVERCGDGLDNDCDGDTDEGFRIGEPCQVGVGACAVTGKWSCSADQLTEICSAQPDLPEAEICGNHQDDNCDGTVDEEPCEPDQGDDESGTGCASGPPRPRGLAVLLLLLLAALSCASMSRRSGPWFQRRNDRP